MVQREKEDQDDRSRGHPRGGLTTKVHTVVDADGLPTQLELTAGQVHDGKPAMQMLEGVPDDSNALRDLAKGKKAWANIPPKAT